ncbi:MAG: ribosomal protein S18-alanine N-acetyltransferase [Candidatus Thorarchaeota archaeon]
MIRRVRWEDIEEVVKIEQESFPVAWEYSIFFNICLAAGKMPSGESRWVFMDVLEKKSSIIGYAVWEIHNRRKEGHILNLAIKSHERKKGLGGLLLKHILGHLKTNGVQVCRLEVRESNLPARQLYESNGFKESSRIRDYYFDEDAVVYTLDL